MGIGARSSVDDVEAIVRSGGGRMPGFEQMHEAWRRAIVDYVVSGDVHDRRRRPAHALRPALLDGRLHTHGRR